MLFNYNIQNSHNLIKKGMKLEAIDKKNTMLTCVATVADILCSWILVHFDGWEDTYDYWCAMSSPYVHPVGWCIENNKTLSPPCGRWWWVWLLNFKFIYHYLYWSKTRKAYLMMHRSASENRYFSIVVL